MPEIEGPTVQSDFKLTPIERKLEYKRQCALKTVSRLESQFEQIKNCLFNEKIALVDEAINNVLNNKDANLVKRIESARLKTSLHLAAAEKRKHLSRLSIQNLRSSFKLILQSQAEHETIHITTYPTSEIETTVTPKLTASTTTHSTTTTITTSSTTNTNNNNSSSVLISTTNGHKEDFSLYMFKQPLKRRKSPDDNNVEVVKRPCLPHLNHADVTTSIQQPPSIDMSPIAAQLSLRSCSSGRVNGKTANHHTIKSNSRLTKPDIAIKRPYIPDETPCFVYRLHMEDIKSDIDFFRANSLKTYPNRSKAHLYEPLGDDFSSHDIAKRKVRTSAAKTSVNVHSNPNIHNVADKVTRPSSSSVSTTYGITTLKNGLISKSRLQSSDNSSLQTTVKKPMSKYIARKSGLPLTKTSRVTPKSYINGTNSSFSSNSYLKSAPPLPMKLDAHTSSSVLTSSFTSDRNRSDLYNLAQGGST